MVLYGVMVYYSSTADTRLQCGALLCSAVQYITV